ncbi:hypothetical protein INR49_017701 [Caranx melampygus]|nr:hypothetical protein INR49_017701 [Caranx melampygus]
MYAHHHAKRQVQTEFMRGADLSYQARTNNLPSSKRQMVLTLSSSSLQHAVEKKMCNGSVHSEHSTVVTKSNGYVCMYPLVLGLEQEVLEQELDSFQGLLEESLQAINHPKLQTTKAISVGRPNVRRWGFGGGGHGVGAGGLVPGGVGSGGLGIAGQGGKPPKPVCTGSVL